MSQKKLPHYELTIDPTPSSEIQVDYVALVDRPAIEKNFLAFNEAPRPLAFAQVNEEERIVLGAAMIPDMPIYRSDPDGKEYYISFSKETVREIALKFYAKAFQNNANLMHQPELKAEGVTFFLSMIRDTEKGMVGLAGDYPEGTWFLGAKIGNDQVWQLVKDGTVKGFSVEGIFQYKSQPAEEPKTAEQIYNEIAELLAQLPE